MSDLRSEPACMAPDGGSPCSSYLELQKEVEALQAVVNATYKDLGERAVDGVVAVGNSVWVSLCDAHQQRTRATP